MKQPNIVVITADDLSYFSLRAAYPKAAPKLLEFENSSVSFGYAHTNISFCEPARCVLMTGKYPHNNGAVGFCPIRPHITTLVELLQAEGYYTGILGKVCHHRPYDKFPWDYCIPAARWDGRARPQVGKFLGEGKQPDLYRKYAQEFVEMAGSKPYFLLCNSHDPHRPYVTPIYDSRKIEVPGFLPNSAEMRHDLACYYSTVARLDKTFSGVMECVDKDAITIFTVDHGMSFPFVKGNNYNFSTNIPLMVRWGDRFKSRKETEHLVSSVDFMSTLLELLDMEAPPQDGVSYVPLLRGERQEDREAVYTQLNYMPVGIPYHVRAVVTKRYCYVYNFTNGEYPAHTVDAWGYHDTLNRIGKQHRDKFIYRRREEFFSIEEDPWCTSHVDNHPLMEEARDKLVAWMHKYSDPLITYFR